MSHSRTCLKDPKWILLVFCSFLLSSQARIQAFRKDGRPVTKIPPFVLSEELPQDRVEIKPIGVIFKNRNYIQPNQGISSLNQVPKVRVRREEQTRTDQTGSHGGYVPPHKGPFLETILFKVAASGLPNTDPFRGEPDPFIQISFTNGTSTNWIHVARTSTLTDMHEARWNDTIRFENYVNGAGQRLRFEIRDHDVADFDDRIGFAYIDLDRCVRESRFYKTETHSCHSLISNDNGILYVSIL